MKAEKAEKKPKEKSAKKEKKVTRGSIDGFLIPTSYRRASAYKHNPIFRSTLLILFLATLIGLGGGYRLLLAKKVVYSHTATQAVLLNETERLQNQNMLLKTTKDRYRELEILRKQLRIPLSPVMDAIEKTIPNEISINGFEFKCVPLATTGSSTRKATMAILVFLPEKIQPSDPLVAQWPTKLFEKMGEEGLKGLNPEWGPPQELILPKTRTQKEIRGFTRLLEYQIELQPQST